jgi:hypothetical protein
MFLKSRASVARASSAMVPAISTPVGPAPTTTKVSSRRTSAGSPHSSAHSNASSNRSRIDNASSRLLSTWVYCAQSSRPKKL